MLFLGSTKKWGIWYRYNKEAVWHIDKKYKRRPSLDSNFLLPSSATSTITSRTSPDRPKSMFSWDTNPTSKDLNYGKLNLSSSTIRTPTQTPSRRCKKEIGSPAPTITSKKTTISTIFWKSTKKKATIWTSPKCKNWPENSWFKNSEQNLSARWSTRTRRPQL